MAVGNNGSRLVGNTEFYGGLSTDSKVGIENSYADAECLDVRKSPSQMTVLPMARKLEGSSTITGLVTAMAQSKDGNLWGVDENGKVYKIDDNNAITNVSTTATSSGFGLEYYDADDGLWFSDSAHSIYSYGKILNAGGAAVSTTKFEFLEDKSEYIVNSIILQQDGDRVIYQSDPDMPRSSGTENVTVKTSVSETNDDKILYLPASIPLAKVGIMFTAKGAGNVRVEIHDENNNVVASSSAIAASNVSTMAYTMFTVRPNPSAVVSATNQYSPRPWSGDTIEAGEVLHIHVIASTGGFTIRSSVAGSLYLTADISSTAYTLHDTFNKKHPMVMFDKLYIGNGRYVSTKEGSPLSYLDDTLFTQNALRIDDGYEVCCFASSDEYLMIGAEKYSVGSTRGFQAGRIYFWDRQTEGPNFYIDCNMGSPKCMYNHGNIVYIIAAGALYAYTGGKELVKVRTLGGTDTEYSDRSSVTEVYPNMMSIRREVLLMGFPSHTTAYKIRHGVYAFGSVDKNFPNCFTYNYKIPGPTTSVTLDQYNSDEQELRIGCVYNFNDALFYSYEVKTTTTPEPTEEVPNPSPVTTTDVALACVDNSSGTSTSYMFKSLQYDAGAPALEKEVLRIGIYFDPLPANTTITPMYRIDNGEWQTAPATAVEGDNYITCDIIKRFHELQYGFVGTTANDLLTPVIKQVSAEIRVLNEEAKL